MQFGLEDKYFEELTTIFRSIPEIEEVVIYGSRARGDYQRVSDIDLSLRGARLEDKHVVQLKTLLYESRIPYFCDVHIGCEIPNLLLILNVMASFVIGVKTDLAGILHVDERQNH